MIILQAGKQEDKRSMVRVFFHVFGRLTKTKDDTSSHFKTLTLDSPHPNLPSLRFLDGPRITRRNSFVYFRSHSARHVPTEPGIPFRCSCLSRPTTPRSLGKGPKRALSVVYATAMNTAIRWGKLFPESEVQSKSRRKRAFRYRYLQKKIEWKKLFPPEKCPNLRLSSSSLEYLKENPNRVCFCWSVFWDCSFYLYRCIPTSLQDNE